MPTKTCYGFLTTLDGAFPALVGDRTRVDAFANLETLLDAASVECDPLPPDSSICAAPVFGDETPCFCLESPEDDWRCAVRYSDDDCTPDSDDECGDEDRRI